MIDRHGYERTASGHLTAPVWHVYIKTPKGEVHIGTAQGSSDMDAMEAVLDERKRKHADPVGSAEIVAREVDPDWFSR